mgnify:CR=1 FL=1
MSCGLFCFLSRPILVEVEQAESKAPDRLCVETRALRFFGRHRVMPPCASIRLLFVGRFARCFRRTLCGRLLGLFAVGNRIRELFEHDARDTRGAHAVG